MTSRLRVFIVMVESIVPMPAMPTVPTTSGATIAGNVGATGTPVMKKK